MSARSRRRRRRRRGPSKLLLGFGSIGAVLALAVLGTLGWVLSVAAQTPTIDELKPIDKGTSSEVLAADGSRLGYIQSDEIRTPIPFADIPTFLREATIAIEDERFYAHSGVDVPGVVRAAVKNFEARETRQGGSTITQQLVRNLYLDEPEQTIKRKIREAKLASELEDRHSKDWILENYLNSVSYGTILGRSAIGVEAAAQTYFSKPAKDLSLEEAALLAGLPQAPSQYNPFQNPGAALERRNEVLQAMARLGYIDRARAEEGYQKPINLDRGDKYTAIREPFFFDYVKQQLIEEYGVNAVRKGGLRVSTTIDPKLQAAGRRAIDGTLNQEGDPSSAVVAIDPKNGYVRAMASSGRYKHKQFNLAAQGHRQPGSAFKTMVLLAAVRNGVDPKATSYTSKPLKVSIPGYGFWKVKTYDNSYGGRMNLVKATLRSDNSVYAQLDIDLTPEEVRRTAYDMGITTKLDAVPSEGLGGLRLGVSPLEMANAYATLASGGIRNRPIAIRSVRFPDGRSDQIGKPKRERKFSDGEVYEVTKILEQNVTAGTGTRAQIGCPAAGKTGTTDNFNDAWFVGFTPRLSTSVWVGYPDALRQMRSVHGISVAGGTFPAGIWGAFMKQAVNGDCASFPTPSTPPDFRPFNGKYATGGATEGLDGDVPFSEDFDPMSGDQTAREQDRGGDNSAGGGGGTGYDPRLYEGEVDPPVNDPEPESRPQPPAAAPRPQQPGTAPAGEGGRGRPPAAGGAQPDSSG